MPPPSGMTCSTSGFPRPRHAHGAGVFVSRIAISRLMEMALKQPRKSVDFSPESA
jgi:hypothetical protein